MKITGVSSPRGAKWIDCDLPLSPGVIYQNTRSGTRFTVTITQGAKINPYQIKKLGRSQYPHFMIDDEIVELGNVKIEFRK